MRTIQYVNNHKPLQTKGVKTTPKHHNIKPKSLASSPFSKAPNKTWDMVIKTQAAAPQYIIKETNFVCKPWLFPKTPSGTHDRKINKNNYCTMKSTTMHWTSNVEALER